MAQTVIAVVDDPALRASLQFAFEIEGFQVDVFATGDAFLAHESFPAQACLVVDHAPPRLDGFKVAMALRQRGIDFPTILITEDPTEPFRQEADAQGLTLVEKPLLGNGLAEAIRNALAVH